MLFLFFFFSVDHIIIIVFIVYFCISYHRQKTQLKDNYGTDLWGLILSITHTEGNLNCVYL